MHKLKYRNGSYWLDNPSKVPFGMGDISTISREKMSEIFDFAYGQSIRINQKPNWHNSSYYRKPKEMFTDTLMGKMGEENTYQLMHAKFSRKFKISPVDYEIYEGQENGDKFDLILQSIDAGEDKHVAVRTTAYFSNLLLMETSKNWDRYDAIFLSRIKPAPKNILKGISISEKDLLRNKFLETDFQIENAGFINKNDFKKKVKNDMILAQGASIQGTTVIKTENYYVPVCDLRTMKKEKQR